MNALTNAGVKRCCLQLVYRNNLFSLKSSSIFRNLQTSIRRLKRPKKEPSPEPYRFTTSDANIKSVTFTEANEYQGLIVALSLTVFLVYFCYLREENDIDEALNFSLFERVPSVEEPHLAQAIPRMKERGLDTTEAEARLRELIQQRQAKERAEGRA